MVNDMAYHFNKVSRKYDKLIKCFCMQITQVYQKD